MEDIATMGAAVGALLKRCGQSVSVAESSSGGMISAALLAQPGASAYFKGGGVVYTGVSKNLLMSLSEAEMVANRAATEPHALSLAAAARKRLDADWGIGETGAAGPSGNRYGDPPGHTCIGISGPVNRTVTVETGSDGRVDNMAAFTSAALALLRDCVEEAMASS
jgi:PncC family amidohydrolase